jgi:SAM-dependent methyltransferase
MTYNLYVRIKRRLIIFVDKICGYDFLSIEEPERLGLHSNLVHRGSPSGNKYLYNVCKSISIQPTDAILDVGCAKGSALKIFTKFPFKKIAGLEISERLSRICRRNFLIYGDDRVEVYTENATCFKYYGLFNIFYLYNPFPTKEILESVVDCIVAQSKGKLTVIYNNPKNLSVFFERGFEVINRFDDEWGKGILLLSRPAAN